MISALGNLSRAGFGAREIAWRPVALFSLGALPASLAGAILFVRLPVPLVMHSIGVFLLVMVAMRHMKVGRQPLPQSWMVPAGGLVGFLSGVVGSAGPLAAAVFLGLELAPTAYVASEAVTATLMHMVKTLTYGKFALLGQRELEGGFALGAAMVAGSWTGRQLLLGMSTARFGYFVEALLALSACALLLS